MASQIAISCHVAEVYSPNREHADALASQVQAQTLDKLENLSPDTDLIIVSVSDAAIVSVLEELPREIPVVITAGTVNSEVLREFKYGGIMYPLQTFTRGREINLAEVPFLLESLSRDFEDTLEVFVREVFGAKSHRINTANRKAIHLAAVIGSNFSNFLLSKSEEVLNSHDIPFEIIKPLMQETIAKAFDLGPKKAQTGPAARGDLEVVSQQLKMLDDPDFAVIYAAISKLINPKVI